MVFISMPGMIALIGGNEFRSDCEPMDRALLSTIGENPTVVILPTAAALENPSLAAGNGVRYFERLGAKAEAAMIVDELTARESKWVDLIDTADMIYFAGGNPELLLRTMRHSPAWKAIVQVWKKGRVLAGSSAGAMILGSRMWAPGKGWRRGLGLVPVAVIPHHSRVAAQWNAGRMRATLPQDVTLIGIDEATALTIPDGRVLGPGKVAVYLAGEPEMFTEGQNVKIWEWGGGALG